jgi:DNA polymerase-3 subunit delta
MIIYIHGEDTFRSRQFLQKSIKEFKLKRDPQGYNTLIFDVAKEAPERILGEIATAPFLAEKRMIVLQNILCNSNKDFLASIIDIIENNKIPESVVVIVWQGEPVGKTSEAKKLLSLLSKEKFSYAFDLLKDNELANWISQEVSLRGGKIDKMASGNLSRLAGPDLWLVNSLIDQLVAYKKGEEIRSADVALFVDEKIDDNIFNMVDAIVGGNKKIAFKLMRDQRASGKDESYLFSMIMRQFKILLQMRDLWEREDSFTSDQIAKRISIHPYVAKKSLPLVKKFSMPELKKIYDELLDIDIKTKTGLADQSVLIDYFVGKI